MSNNKSVVLRALSIFFGAVLIIIGIIAFFNYISIELWLRLTLIFIGGYLSITGIAGLTRK
ncbi:hypothetical protein ACFLQS_01675 [Actinomycetota bacterium]